MAPAVRPPSREEGNTLYPLHPHHMEMTDDERRTDRLNAIRLQETPDDLVEAWSFFRTWYLRQAGRMFYKRWQPSPAFHYQIVRDIARYPYNAIAAPRGTSKSTVLSVEVPLFLLLTRAYFNILLVLSIDTMVTKRVKTQILYQLEHNPLIRADFGEVLPSKGQGARSVHLVQLLNGSTLESRPVKGAMLGARPDLILIDDAEIDPVLNKVSPELVENFDRFLTNILLPMLDIEEGGGLDNEGVSLYWIGTLLAKKCFLYHVVTTDDPRFEFWNRRLLDLEDDGQGHLLWPDKFPLARLERQKAAWGAASYNAQCRNRPGTGEDLVLKLHPQLAHYEVRDQDEDFHKNPLASKAVLRAYRGTSEVQELVERPFGQAVSGMFRVLMFDWAKCLRPTSDFCAFQVMGVEMIDPFPNVWWSLDLHVERLPGSSWLPKLLEMACKWQVTYIGIEAVAAQETLVHAAGAYIELMTKEWNWVPRAVPIKYPSNISKEERIQAALEWRFEQFRVKLPHPSVYPDRAHQLSYWKTNRSLFEQIGGFTGLEGALRFDDALDTLAMTQHLVGGRRVRSGSSARDETSEYNIDVVESLSKGKTTVKGIQVGLAVDPREVPHSVQNRLAFDHLCGSGPETQNDKNEDDDSQSPFIGTV